MNLHEYQAKNLFKQYNMPVPNGRVVHSLDEIPDALSALGSEKWVVKAQVHAGGRGKAGGVKLVETKADVEAAVKSLLGRSLVTYQTTAKGQPVNSVLIEETCQIDKELYLGAVIDRSCQRLVIMASTEGGVEIEKVADETPEKILKVTVDPLVGLQPFQCRELGFGLGLNSAQLKQLAKLVFALGKMFNECDLSLVEINPLVITASGDLLCLDGKVNIDSNALYRQSALAEWRDISQEDARETQAQQSGLNYISLEGDIGCMVNGAGLAMATMDLIKLCGGNPANFLDVGGGATQASVTEAFKIILSDENVKGVLVNIFGGIVRCDLIADGVIAAVKEVGIKVPVVARLAGNRADIGLKRFSESGLNIIPAQGFAEAAQKIVDQVKKGSA